MPNTELTKRYKKFRAESYPELRDLYERLATEGQTPQVLMISCCDSRVNPDQILSAEPGELFMVRNIANMVPPYTPDDAHHGTASAIEFAVRFLEVGHIMIMGHAKCGGIQALYDGVDSLGKKSDFIHNWVEQGETAKARVLKNNNDCSREDQLIALEQANIQLGLENLLTYPWLKERVDAGKLQLYGLRFDIGNATLTEFDPKSNKFEPIK